MMLSFSVLSAATDLFLDVNCIDEGLRVLVLAPVLVDGIDLFIRTNYLCTVRRTMSTVVGC
jgi:hypothetical protein